MVKSPSTQWAMRIGWAMLRGPGERFASFTGITTFRCCSIAGMPTLGTLGELGEVSTMWMPGCVMMCLRMRYRVAPSYSNFMWGQEGYTSGWHGIFQVPKPCVTCQVGVDLLVT